MSANAAHPSPTTTLGPRFTRALEWASELHRDQTRKGSSVPYVSHLLEVAALVLQDGGRELSLIHI